MTTVCVIGQGHIGLPTALTIAASGLKVTGVDTDESLVARLSSGENSLVEPGLTELLNSCIDNNKYKAQTTPESADVFIVSVPTPLNTENSPVLDYVIAAAKSIAPKIKSGTLVILESTVPPGTTGGAFEKTLSEYSTLISGQDYQIAHCPERVLPGTILKELVENDRVVGGMTVEASHAAAKFYGRFVTGEIFETDAVTAELVKLSENVYRDVNIGLANEFAIISEDLGANVWDVIDLANKHPRVNIHQPGPGVGGYCIPVAPWMLNNNLDNPAETVLKARKINAAQPERIVKQAVELVAEINHPKVAILGAAYKGGVGDARATPTLEIVERLLDHSCEVTVHDPHTTNFKYLLSSFDSALKDADIAIIVTDHAEFTKINPEIVAELMATPLIVDTRNVLNRSEWERAGFTVIKLGVGR